MMTDIKEPNPKCSKPGCGAQCIIGKPCTDWDCPQVFVHYTVCNALVEEKEREVADRLRKQIIKLGYEPVV